MASEAILERLPARTTALELPHPLHDRPSPRPRLNLGGVLIDRVNLADAVERMHGFLRSGVPHQVVTVNLDFLRLASRNPEFRSAINRADLAVADGMPLIWLSRMRGDPLTERVAGVELVDASCRLAATTGHSAYLLGAAP